MHVGVRAVVLVTLVGLAPALAEAQEAPAPGDGLPGFVFEPPGWLGRGFQVAVLPARGSPWLTELNERRLSANQLGAGVLAGWSALHVFGAGAGSFFVDDPQLRALLRADAAVSTIAIGSAVAGLIVAAGIDPAQLDYSESLQKGLLLERLLIFGIGLDLAAIAGGGALWAVGDTDEIVGYGQGLLLQGAALLLFDLALLGVNLEFEDRLLVVLDRPLGDVIRFGLGFRF